MGDVAASVGFAGWAFAAMCDHALFPAFLSFKGAWYFFIYPLSISGV
jgi:hypothetical protein